MLERLKPWQRFWGMFAIVFLASTLALIAALWPKPDAALLADLRAPECGQWLALPEDRLPDDYPGPTAQCRVLRGFLRDEHVALRSEADYESYLTGEGVRIALICLASWAGFMGATYLIGWSSGRAVRVVREKRGGHGA